MLATSAFPGGGGGDPLAGSHGAFSGADGVPIRPPADHRDQRDPLERGWGGCGNATLAVLVLGELGFVFACVTWARLTTVESLQAAVGATALGLLAVHGKAALLAVGRRVFLNR